MITGGEGPGWQGRAPSPGSSSSPVIGRRNSGVVFPDDPGIVQVSYAPHLVWCAAGPAIPALFASWASASLPAFRIAVVFGTLGTVLAFVSVTLICRENVRLRLRYQHSGSKSIGSVHMAAERLFQASASAIGISILIMLVAMFL